MGEVSLNSASLLSSIASMYDNRLFSDVELIFMTDNGERERGRMFCHSLILAIRSKKFATMFYELPKQKTPFEVKLPFSKASSFSHLVRFLYTDELQLCTFEEAQELYDLAAEYGVEEIKEKCSNFILIEELNIDNLFSKYEYALCKGMHILLKECQNFVCSNSQLVLESAGFTNASLDVVEDIVKLDNLSVSTELEVIGAILKWGSEELERLKLSLDEKNLRRCIDPLKKHVRFLTLSREEFEYIIDNYDIFSSKECSKLTQRMMDPLCNVALPDSLSSVSVKRTRKVSSNSKSFVSSHKNASSNSSINMTIPPIQSLNINDDSSKRFNFSVERKQSAIPLNNSSSNRSLKRSSSESLSQSLSNSNLSSQISPKSLTSVANSDIPQFHASDTNKVSFQIKKISAFDESSQRLNVVDEVNYSFKPTLKDTSLVSRMVNGSCRLQNYEFPLQESVKCFRTSFPNDMKSTISFHMMTGNILLRGFEIKLENKSGESDEELEIDVDMKGFSKQPFTRLYKEKLKDNLVIIKLPENMVLQANNKGKLEVSIDSLLLNRCNTCDSSKPFELNCGNGFSCEMTLSSNQRTEKGFLFLVSKLIYSPLP